MVATGLRLEQPFLDHKLSGAPFDNGGFLSVRWLGRMDFPDALALQEKIVAQKREDRGWEDELLLLEHEPVYTIGRTPNSIQLVRRGALAVSALLDQSRWTGDLSRAGPIDRISHCRFASVRAGFAQIFALARATAHRGSVGVRISRDAARVAHGRVG